MAISQTMSNPSDWLYQPYQNNDFSHINNQFQTSLTNTFSSSTSAAAAAATAARANTSSNSLSPEQGRVAKPVRRRSRASRRTPTTLLNTDTTNFRAMVQHFTGGPAAAASSVSFAARPQIPNRGAAPGYMEHAAAAAAQQGGFHVQYPNHMQQQQQLLPHQMFVMDNGGGGGGAPPQTAPGSGNRVNYDNYML